MSKLTRNEIEEIVRIAMDRIREELRQTDKAEEKSIYEGMTPEQIKARMALGKIDEE